MKIFWAICLMAGSLMAADPPAAEPTPFDQIKPADPAKPFPTLRRFVISTTPTTRAEGGFAEGATRGILTLRTKASSFATQTMDQWEQQHGRVIYEFACGVQSPLLPKQLVRIDQPENQEKKTARYALQNNQMAGFKLDPIPWPKQTVPLTSLYRLIEHLPDKTGTAYRFDALFDPMREPTPIKRGHLLIHEGPHKVEAKTWTRWRLKSLDADPPQINISFWLDENKTLVRVHRPGIGLRLDRMDALDADQVSFDIQKLSGWKKRQFRFTRTFTGSNLKMEGTWETETLVLMSSLLLRDKFATKFRGNDSQVTWEAYFDPKQPARPNAYTAIEGHEKHLHKTQAKSTDQGIEIHTTEHEGQTAQFTKPWPKHGAMRTSLARLVTLLPQKTGWSMRLAKVFDGPDLTDDVGAQTLYARGWARLNKANGQTVTCMRYVAEPDNGALLARQSTYWIDKDRALHRVELAGGLIRYDLNESE